MDQRWCLYFPMLPRRAMCYYFFQVIVIIPKSLECHSVWKMLYEVMYFMVVNWDKVERFGVMMIGINIR